MKKLFLLLLFIPLVFAAPEDPVTIDSRNFTLQIEFTEPVTIVGSQATISAEYPSTFERTVQASNPSSDFTTYDFLVGSPLPNGVYEFTLDYYRRGSTFSSQLTFTKQITIEAEEEDIPYLFDIEVISPPNGFHNVREDFDIILSTEFPATCRYLFDSWDVYDAMINTQITDSANGLSHTLRYTGSSSEQNYWIGCRTTDGARIESYKKFLFGFTDGISEITNIKQIPNPVNDRAERYADLEIATEDKTVCRLTYESNNGLIYNYPSNQDWNIIKNNFSEYNSKNTLRVCFEEICEGLSVPDSYDVLGTEKQEYDIAVSCFNRANLKDTKTHKALVEYSEDARLSYVRPERYERAQPVPINLVSILNLERCEYNIDSQYTEIEDWPDYKGSLRNFTTTITLDEGDHTITSRCRRQYVQEYIKSTKEFTVDRTAPTGFSYTLPQVICEDKDFEITWDAEDEVSRVDRFYYEVLDGDEVVDSGDFSSKEKDIDINAEPGTYDFSAYVTDRAGNPTSKAKKTINLLNESDDKCDTEAPEVVVRQYPKEDLTKFKVTCNDDGSGCYSSYDYNLWPGSKTSNANCTYDKTGTLETEYEATITSILCYKVEDKAGNVAEGKEKINVDLSTKVNRCENNIKDGDESGVDCGGSCDRCDAGSSCTSNADCTTGVCTESGVCGEEEFECYKDWECAIGEVCEYPKCVVDRSTPANNTPAECTTDNQCSFDEECVSGRCIFVRGPINKEFNWLALIIGVLGVVLLGGGGYAYFASPGMPAKTSGKTSMSNTKLPDLSINKNKTLDLKDTKKIKELRDKLSKQLPGNRRKTMMRAFETPEATDKDIPAGIEKTNIDLIPRLKPKPVTKKVPQIKPASKAKSTSKSASTTKKSTKKKTDEYIPLENLNKKKKDVFDELEDL